MVNMKQQSGLTIVEVLASVAIGALVLLAIVSFSSRVFSGARVNFEQGKIVGDARVEMERMSDALRNARNVDFDGSGVIDAPGEQWLQYASDYEIEFYTNLDGDDSPELVRYWLQGTDLVRRVSQVGASCTIGPPVTQSVSFRNGEQGQDLFSYFSVGGGKAVDLSVPVLDRGAVDRIVMNFVIDVDTAQIPDAAYIDTVVTPRKGDYSLGTVLGNCVSLEIVQCNDGFDNDNDGLIDLADIGGCKNVNDKNEWALNATQCNDGFDNNGNGLIDSSGINADWTCTNPGDKSEMLAGKQ